MNQERVLVIEDHDHIRELLREALTAVPYYQISEAGDGAHGLQSALACAPDIILLDLSLPDMSGLEVLERLRETGHSMPVIVITANDQAEAILRAFRLGAQDFLSKPFKLRRLWESMDKALRAERLRREKDRLTRALAKANRSLKRQLDQRVALNYIAKTLISTLDETEVLRRVMATINHLLSVEAGSLLLSDEEAEKLSFVMTLEGSAERFADFKISLGEGIAGWVAQHGQPLLISNVEEDPRFSPLIDKVTGFRTRSILCVPLKTKSRVLGVLEVINKRSENGPAAFTREDLDLLITLASWVTVAVENARLNQSMQDQAAFNALRQTVIALTHHINNVLQVFALELDALEEADIQDPQSVVDFTTSARARMREIINIMKALDEMHELHSVEYAGTMEMLNLET